VRAMKVAGFARLCGGVCHGVPDGAEFAGFDLDSRTARAGRLFVAIRGRRHDGHEMAGAALAAGCVATLAERAVEGPHILVGSVVEALARAAGAWRDGFAGPVVGITGSNGKTTTKEFAAAVLAGLGPVLKSPGNHNTEYTAPLVWADAEGKAAAVVELAMRGPGQIRHLASFIRPTVAVVTNIGTAHIETVGSRHGIFEAKSEIFEHGPDAAVVWREDEVFPLLRERAGARLLTFGASEDADVRAVGYRALAWDRCEVRLAWEGKAESVEMPTLGRHQALNAAAAVAAALLCGAGFEASVARLADAVLPAMRMQRVEHRGATVLLDTYNASAESMVAAIEALAELPCRGRRLAVLGEMRELGQYSESFHRRVGRTLGANPVDALLLVGPTTPAILEEATAAGFPPERATWLPDVDIHRIRAFLNTLSPNDIALVKGSRALELERALEEAPA
jgi:UDP-N-acetylmuramoyl-tripeptide--D-alanyl-D-alanine ligase